jgi:hypothetical protein
MNIAAPQAFIHGDAFGPRIAALPMYDLPELHAASAVAVADGDADVAAIDCVT